MSVETSVKEVSRYSEQTIYNIDTSISMLEAKRPQGFENTLDKARPLEENVKKLRYTILKLQQQYENQEIPSDMLTQINEALQKVNQVNERLKRFAQEDVQDSLDQDMNDINELCTQILSLKLKPKENKGRNFDEPMDIQTLRQTAKDDVAKFMMGSKGYQDGTKTVRQEMSDNIDALLNLPGIVKDFFQNVSREDVRDMCKGLYTLIFDQQNSGLLMDIIREKKVDLAALKSDISMMLEKGDLDMMHYYLGAKGVPLMAGITLNKFSFPKLGMLGKTAKVEGAMVKQEGKVVKEFGAGTHQVNEFKGGEISNKLTHLDDEALNIVLPFMGRLEKVLKEQNLLINEIKNPQKLINFRKSLENAITFLEKRIDGNKLSRENIERLLNTIGGIRNGIEKIIANNSINNRIRDELEYILTKPNFKQVYDKLFYLRRELN